MSMLELQHQQLNAMGHDITDNHACIGEFTKRVCCYDYAAIPGIGQEEVHSTEATYST